MSHLRPFLGFEILRSESFQYTYDKRIEFDAFIVRKGIKNLKYLAL